jgi:hypothetical protein
VSRVSEDDVLFGYRVVAAFLAAGRARPDEAAAASDRPGLRRRGRVILYTVGMLAHVLFSGS